VSASSNKVRATETVRNWNAAFPIGTAVEFEGRAARTWSHAGLGSRDEPVVYLENIQEPIPLSRLTVPGWEMAAGRKR
jgi:hypothetical protein